MHRPEQAAARSLAYMWYRDHRQDDHATAWAWAGEHWMEFLAEIDGETGTLMQAAFRTLNEQEKKKGKVRP